MPLNKTAAKDGRVHTRIACDQSMGYIRDTLYVLGGKWKLPIISTLVERPRRFKELQKELGDITPKTLSKELKELELNEFVIRTVYATSPVSVEYELTDYAISLDPVLQELRKWGFEHRQRLRQTIKRDRKAAAEESHS